MESIRKLIDRYGDGIEVALMTAVLRDEAVDAGLRAMFYDVYGVSTENGDVNGFAFSTMKASGDVWEFADALADGPFYRRSKIPPMVSEGAFAMAMMDAGLFDAAFRLYREWKDKK